MSALSPLGACRLPWWGRVLEEERGATLRKHGAVRPRCQPNALPMTPRFNHHVNAR